MSYTAWQQLCKEYESAREDYFKAFAQVNSKLTAIYQGSSRTNPSEKELSEMDSTCKKWESIQLRMKDFIKVHV
jgi:hypothetical protein